MNPIIFATDGKYFSDLSILDCKAIMTLEEALHNNDMNDIIDSMTAYVYIRIKTIGVKDLEGKTPEDFVGEVLMKVAEGERD